MPRESWHGSCFVLIAPSGAGAHRRPDLEQGLAKRSRGKPGGRMSGDVRPLFFLAIGQKNPKFRAAKPWAPSLSLQSLRLPPRPLTKGAADSVGLSRRLSPRSTHSWNLSSQTSRPGLGGVGRVVCALPRMARGPEWAPTPDGDGTGGIRGSSPGADMEAGLLCCLRPKAT